jgi:antibiotic biosynthesis monooxygenase (ABM) superfamily enzyme
MPHIDSRRKLCTVIIVFTVLPERSQELVELLKNTTTEVFKKLPGHISTSLHISDDKTTITNYVQWASLADFKNMSEQTPVINFLEKANEIAIDINPVTYNAIWCT